jgi:hypothetical protein
MEGIHPSRALRPRLGNTNGEARQGIRIIGCRLAEGHLDKLLARPSKVADVEHHAALPFTEVGDPMQRLREAKGSARA